MNEKEKMKRKKWDSLQDFLVDKLLEDGFSGVAGVECGCSLDEFPLCECVNLQDCVPGYKHVNCPCCNYWQVTECYTPFPQSMNACKAAVRRWNRRTEMTEE